MHDTEKSYVEALKNLVTVNDRFGSALSCDEEGEEDERRGSFVSLEILSADERQSHCFR